MKKGKLMCDNCGKYPAVAKDYREYKHHSEQPIVCRWCLNMNDEWFEKVKREKLDPQKVYFP